MLLLNRAIGGSWTGKWRRRPDLNRGWRFCRPLPYLLATAPLNTTRPVEGRAVARRLACHPTLSCPARRRPLTSARGATNGPPGRNSRERRMERETGFEPATSTLARSHSTTELFPPEPPP